MFHHVEVNVYNLKRSREFYEFLFSKLGYSLYQEWDKGFSYKNKDTYIVFVQTKEKYLKNDYHRKHVGLNHLAFKVNNLDLLNEIREEFKDLGITELYADKYPKAGGVYDALYFEDPDRLKIELVVE